MEINTFITDNESQASFFLDQLAFYNFMHVLDGFFLSHPQFLRRSHPWHPHFSLQVPSLTSIPMFWDPPDVNWHYLSGHGFSALLGAWWCTTIIWYISEDSSWLSPESIRGQISSAERGSIPGAHPWPMIGCDSHMLLMGFGPSCASSVGTTAAVSPCWQ